jgi:pyruvate dehydrogenase E2 component (dihydrolipoamide acetyltransferase)
MVTEVRMPRLSLTMESGVILQWLKAEGDAVAKGEAPAGGFVRRLLVEVGASVPCDTAVALLTTSADEPLDGAAPLASATASGEAAVAREAAAPVPPAPPAPTGRAHLNASPAAKNLARQLNVDLATVTGTGPGGRIGLEDVQRAADARDAAQASGAGPVLAHSGDRRVPLGRMRAAMAQQMTVSTTTIPQFTVRRRVDASTALRLIGAAEVPAGTRGPGIADALHLAVIQALLAHPEVNASFEPGPSMESSHIVLHAAVNLGIAVAVPDGLVVPVIRDAERLSLDELAAERRRLQEEARSGRLSIDSLTGATFTVSNLGTMHVDEFTAIVNPPQAAILAVGRMQQDLVVRDGAIHTLPMINLTVTADHRILDGAAVAQFLETLSRCLEQMGEGTQHGS